MKHNDLAYYLQKFLTEYLPNEKGFGINTIDTYRYAFILLIEYYKSIGYQINKIEIKDITRKKIEEFLDWLEKEKNNSITTRNLRLAAIHSFINYLQFEYPDYLSNYSNILKISKKKDKKKTVAYMSVEEIKLLINQIDTTRKQGYREYMIIYVMYETAVRVSELCNIRLADIHFIKPYYLKVLGKGKKERIIPISELLVEKIEKYIQIMDIDNKPKTYLLFFNSRMEKLTRAGVSYILDKYVTLAKRNNTDYFNFDISPHTLRHSKAMHLLADGVNLIYIRDFLGHRSIITTEIYARADSEKKRKAIETAYKNINPTEEPQWKNKNILDWLKDFNK